jgi:hypothetical protein
MSPRASGHHESRRRGANQKQGLVMGHGQYRLRRASDRPARALLSRRRIMWRTPAPRSSRLESLKHSQNVVADPVESM